MKTVFHYMNGSTYTIKNAHVSCCLDWEEGYVTMISNEDNYPMGTEETWKVKVYDDLLAIEQIYNEWGIYSLWKNPKYDLSVKVDIKTVGQRMKENRTKKDETTYLNSSEANKKRLEDSITQLNREENKKLVWENKPDLEAGYVEDWYARGKNKTYNVCVHKGRSFACLYDGSVLWQDVQNEGTVEELKTIAQQLEDEEG